MRLVTFCWLTTLLYAFTAGAQSTDTGKNPFINSRITFSFGDDNVLVGAGETKQSSPSAYFGNCSETILSRTTNSQCNGSATNLLLYKRLKVSEHFQPEAALSIALKLDDYNDTKIQDSGSYIRANYFLDTKHETYWSITLFPIDADRMRLGYHYDVSYGGTDSFPRNFRRGGAPGLRYDLDMRYWHLFIGAKAALVRSPANDILDNPGGNTIKNVERTFYGVLGGAGVEFFDTGLRLEFNGGFFHKGTNTRPNALGDNIYSGGLSGRLSYQRGLPVGRQIDTRIYQQDPVRDQLFKKEAYKGGSVSYRLALETTAVIQNLEDPDHVRSTRNETSLMGHAGFGLKAGHFRLHLDATYRDLTAITFDVPGIVPYQALSKDSVQSPEIYASISVDYHFEPTDITLALTAGMLMPATYKGTIPGASSTVDQGLRKMVVRGSSAGDWDILPAGQDELTVWVSRLDFKWSYHDAFGVIAQIHYTRDDNTAQVVQDDKGHNIRTFDEPNRLGFTVLSQVTF